MTVNWDHRMGRIIKKMFAQVYGAPEQVSKWYYRWYIVINTWKISTKVFIYWWWLLLLSSALLSVRGVAQADSKSRSPAYTQHFQVITLSLSPLILMIFSCIHSVHCTSTTLICHRSCANLCFLASNHEIGPHLTQLCWELFFCFLFFLTIWCLTLNLPHTSEIPSTSHATPFHLWSRL